MTEAIPISSSPSKYVHIVIFDQTFNTLTEELDTYRDLLSNTNEKIKKKKHVFK